MFSVKYRQRWGFRGWQLLTGLSVPMFQKPLYQRLVTPIYMPALSAKQHDPHVKAYFQHLVANGKKPLQAVCAIMRKSLHAIHGMLKNNKPYDNTRFYAIPVSAR